jgi:type II secretory pathway pseudopilin PulG
LPGPSAGFTLFELLAIMIIIGAVLAVILPRFSGTTGMNLKSDAKRLSTLVRYLDEAAATKRVYYKADFDIDNGTVRVDESAEGGGEGAVGGYAPVADPVIRGLRLGQGVRFDDIVLARLGTVSSGTVSVFFTPTGSTEPFTLHLSIGEGGVARGGRGGRGGIGEKNAMTISFNPYSGRVKVFEGYL